MAKLRGLAYGIGMETMTYRLRTHLQAAAACLALLLGVAGGVEGNETRGNIVVAQAADFSGPDADFSRDFSLGAKVYFDHINATGGINGSRIVYRQGDSAASSAKSLALAQGFVKEGAQVLFGFTGDQSVSAVAQDPAVRASGVPLFAPIASSTSAGIHENVFHLRADVNAEVRALVANLTTLGFRTFGLAIAGNYGKDTLAVVEAELVANSAKLVSRANLAAGGDGLAKAAEAIAKGRPQAVIVLADTLAASQFLRLYRAKDPGAFLGATSVVNVRTLVSVVGPGIARGLVVSQVVPNPLAMIDISREHRKLMDRYADEPVSQATLEGFVAAKAMVQLLRRSKDLSRASIQQAIADGGRVDSGGLELNIAKGARASKFVEIAVVGPEGRLIR